MFVAFLFFLSACDNQSDPPESPDATPALAPTFTPTADVLPPQGGAAASQETPAVETQVAPTETPLPTATFTPSPTPDTASLLRAGQELRRVGDYTGARAAFGQILAMSDATLPTRLQARYDLARTLLADNAPGEALSMLDALDAEAAAAGASVSDFLSKDHFLRARALSGLGEHSAAIAAYWRFLETYPWMAEHVQQRIAEEYIALGDIDGAAAAYRRAADATEDTVSRVSLLETLGKVLSGVGRYGDAVAVYDEILAVAQNPAYRAEIQYLAGQSLASAGDGAGAIERWRAATAEAPAARSAYLALVELVNRGVNFDLYQRGFIDLQADAYFPAIAAYEAYLAASEPSDSRYARALHELGQSHLGAEQYDAAIAAFDRVIAEFPDCDCFGQAWLDKARAQIAAGDTAGARRTYRTFARDHAGDPLAADALWLSGVRALRDDNEVEATLDFLSLAESFPNSPRAPDALYALGVGALQKGFYGQAADLYRRLQADYPEYKWPAVSYWLGRSYQARGDDDLARAQWQALADKAPDIYYGILATQALNRLPLTDAAMLRELPRVVGPASRLPGDDSSQAFAEAWLAAWPAMGDAESLSALPASLAGDLDLSKGQMLLQLDQRVDALAALDRLFTRHRDNPQALYPLSLEFERMGAFRHSIMAMARLLEFSPAGLVEDAPIFLQRRAYPRHFEELVEKEALAKSINPLLYYSIIRQESLFEEGARSYAAAQGLAQIIPDTARWVAERQGHPEWSNELIYRPYINLNFGAYYLDWARSYLDGNMVSALVGYNAGPGNAEYWRELSGPDDTLFVEVLGVNEPRLYVQLILGNLYHYTRLYGGSRVSSR
jgi:soluble lytic murein transglycosylase